MGNFKLKNHMPPLRYFKTSLSSVSSNGMMVTSQPKIPKKGKSRLSVHLATAGKKYVECTP